ncbi:MAG: ABC transporter ATP-binding protein [Clostridium sp.]|uniref:ABC transporter ATP-binding protein n=1 Tax=Clostridium sp. TaxID=1506 RepID=UPI002FCC69C0
MFKLIKHLKKYWVAIVLIIGLLVIQASADLSLPEYTSRIVNVGIQQGGVEDSAIKVIKEKDLNNLLLFIDANNKEEILKQYTLVDGKNIKESSFSKYFTSYDKINNHRIYLLKESLTEEEVSRVSSILAKPMLIVESLNDPKTAAMLKGEINKTLPPAMKLGSDDNLIEFLGKIDQEARFKIRDKFLEKFDSMPEGILAQAATSYVRAEYKAIGIDDSKLQNGFIMITGGKMLLLALVSLVATVVVGFIGARVAASLGRDLRGDVYSKVVNFSSAEMDKFSTASLITRSTNDIQQIQLLMVMLLRVVFYAPILGIGGIIKVMGTESSMSWIIAVAVVAILSLVAILFGLAMPKFKSLQKLVDKVNLVTREILTGMMVSRAFGTSKHEEERFDHANRDLTRTNLFVNRTMATMMPLMMLIMNGIAVLIVWNGAHNVDAGTMQVGDMMAFIQYTMQIIMSFLMISMISIMLPRATVAAARVDEILTTPLSIKDKETVTELTNHINQIEFKNVYFKYPNAEDYVLKNLNFTMNKGKTTAIIGSTGSGKSTLINLIPRFYDVTKGEILVNGIDIREVSQKKLRDKIGFVPQKGVLFSGTIESNLKYGKQSASEEEIEKAARISQSLEFINAKEDGYNSEISQGGSNVSGGQKQRLSIARAIAKSPDMYIFDDSFSALDYKTDVALRRELSRETTESIVLIVAQRISTILHADQIIVLDEGNIAGIGKHKELLKNCQVYREIALSQLSKEELEDE